MMFDIVQQYFGPVAICFFLILFIMSNRHFEDRINHLFLYAGICILLLVFVDAWEWIKELDTEPSMLRVLLSAMGYSLRCALAYLISLIALRDMSRKQVFLFTLPLVINAVVVFSALISPLAFSYDASNHFVRGPLGVTPFIVSAIYVIFLVVVTVSKWTKGINEEATITFAIAGMTVVAIAMESIYNFKAILPLVCAISITFYYLFFHTTLNERDALTGVLTRKKFYLDARHYENSLSAVISLDVNDLKLHNDKYGHLEGDRVLTTVVHTVESCLNKNADMYRTGGDEFMILCYKFSKEDVEQLINKIQEKMSKTKYTIAIGYSMFDKSLGLHAACLESDASMYVHKNKTKS